MATLEKFDRVMLDASALIGIIKGDPEFACLRSLLAAIERREVKLVESTAILTEVLAKHQRDSPTHTDARTAALKLLESPTTELVDVSVVVARKAGELRVAHGLKTWDAIHLATAIVARVDVLIARDRKFPKNQIEGVYVTEPFDIDGDKLFSGSNFSPGSGDRLANQADRG